MRFLPAYDNAVLGHADRTRIVGPEARRHVNPGHSVVQPTVLVDGFVTGTWSWHGSTLTVTPSRPLSPPETIDVLDEARAVLAHISPTAPGTAVTLA